MLRDAGYSASQIRDCLRLLEPGDSPVSTLLSLKAPTPLDFVAEGRLLHQIGVALSKEFGSAQHVVRRLAHAPKAPEGQVVVSFRECVHVLREDNAEMSSLSPGHIQQLCEKAGGNGDGGIGEEALSTLMQKHD